jgi:hypothetical protein
VLGIGTLSTTISNSGNASIFVGDNGSIAGIQGRLNLLNTSGGDNIVINDSNDSVGQTYNLSRFPDNELTSTAMTGEINWGSVGTNGVTLTGGSGGNVFNISGTSVATTISGGSGANAFNVVAPDSLGADIVGTLSLDGGGNPNTGLTLNDQHDPNSETFNFDIPQAGTGTLTLGSNPSFNLVFAGMTNFVDLATNGFSTVTDPSGTVNVIS